MEQNPNSLSKFDTKTSEKIRRNEMNSLYTELRALVPRQSSPEMVSLPDLLDGATNHIKNLQSNLESMKQKKEMLMLKKKNRGPNFRSSFCGDSSPGGPKPPRIELDFCGSTLDVVLVTGLKYEFMLTQIVRILHEEGVDVVSTSFTVVDDETVFHTLHSKIGLEYEAARICERIRKLVIDDNNGSTSISYLHENSSSQTDL